jgi:transaldolase
LFSPAVNTMTEQTTAALLDHGSIAADTVERGIEDANRIMGDLDRLRIHFADIAEQLERDGVQKFAEALAQSLAHIGHEFDGTNLSGSRYRAGGVFADSTVAPAME